MNIYGITPAEDLIYIQNNQYFDVYFLHRRNDEIVWCYHYWMLKNSFKDRLLSFPGIYYLLSKTKGRFNFRDDEDSISIQFNNEDLDVLFPFYLLFESVDQL